MSHSLLKLQIGPVQDFIAQARSTRDLWSGSYLISWLMANAVKTVIDKCGSKALIFPSTHQQPILDWLANPRSKPQNVRAILTPNLPNVLVATLDADAAEGSEIAKAAAHRIRKEWQTIAVECWKKLAEDGLASGNMKSRFESQVSRFLSISWRVTPWRHDYRTTSRMNRWELESIRQTHEFRGWNDGTRRVGPNQNKDFLTGREEAIVGGAKWWNENVMELHERNPGGFWPTAFRSRHSGDYYGAISLIKRLWHCTYLQDRLDLDVFENMRVPSTRHVARHDPDKNEDAEENGSSEDSQAYFAVLAMDGDQMGKRLIQMDESDHREFSAGLSKFALEQAPSIVSRHYGCLIYAGGDDVLALLPSDEALSCATELREQFRKELKSDVDASVGISVAHYMEPLQDVVRASQSAEQRAKIEGGRSAVAVSLFSRGGETVHWHCKWSPPNGGGLNLLNAVQTALEDRKLSARFPHRVIELLSAYLLDPAEKGRCLFAPAADFNLHEVAKREFAFVLSRQHGPQWEPTLAEVLLKHLQAYLVQLDQFCDSTGRKLDDNDKLHALIGLFQTVAFIKRNRALVTTEATLQPQN